MWSGYEVDVDARGYMLVSNVFLFSHELYVNGKHLPVQASLKTASNLGLH